MPSWTLNLAAIACCATKWHHKHWSWYPLHAVLLNGITNTGAVSHCMLCHQMASRTLELIAIACCATKLAESVPPWKCKASGGFSRTRAWHPRYIFLLCYVSCPAICLAICSFKSSIPSVIIFVSVDPAVSFVLYTFYNATKCLWTSRSLSVYLIDIDYCLIPVHYWVPSTIIANWRESSCNCYLNNLITFCRSESDNDEPSCFYSTDAYRVIAFWGIDLAAEAGKNVDLTCVLS